ncbi:MAG: hypothetical protein RL095_3323 [Verrucomicrobiota bacterium]|jgi:hypothetical protein
MKFKASITISPTFSDQHFWIVDISDDRGFICGESRKIYGEWSLLASDLITFRDFINNCRFPEFVHDSHERDGIRIIILFEFENGGFSIDFQGSSSSASPEYDFFLKWCWRGLYINSSEPYRNKLSDINFDWSEPIIKTVNGLDVYGVIFSRHCANFKKYFELIDEMEWPEVNLVNVKGIGPGVDQYFRHRHLGNKKIVWVIGSSNENLFRKVFDSNSMIVKISDSL